MAMEIKVGFEQTAQTLDVAFSNAQVFNSTYIPPIATTDEVGLVKPDGETITISEDGTITATAKEPSVATTETAGIVKPDGSTITVDADGTIHAVSDVGTGGGIIEIPDQYVRITDLDSGIYKLTYEGYKYIYYNGATDTQTTNYGFVNPFILNVTKKQNTKDSTAYWDWYTICYTSGTTNGNPVITFGATTVSRGSIDSKNFNLLLDSISGYVKNNLTTTQNNNQYALSAYQGYVLDQRLQEVENHTVDVVQTTGDSETAVMSQKAVTDALANVGTGGETASGIPFIASSAFTVVAGEYNLATKWSVPSVGGVTEPTDGMIIAVRTPNGGAGGGVLLSIDGGSNYYPLLMNNDTIVKTVYSNNNTLILTFNPTAKATVNMPAGGYTTITGCWQIADYFEDNKVNQWHTTNDKNYPILFKYVAGTTSTGSSTTYAQFSNNIYVNPSTGTMYANDFVVGGQSLDQRLQAVENLLAGVGVAEEGEF